MVEQQHRQQQQQQLPAQPQRNDTTDGTGNSEQLLDVAVVGGGVGGLSAALALQLAKPEARVRVFERDQEVDDRKQVRDRAIMSEPLTNSHCGDQRRRSSFN